MNLIRKFNMKKVYILMLIILWSSIYLNVPIGHDDWTWGSYIGMERLTTLFDNYNGRYFGGILTVILTRSFLLRLLIMVSVGVLVSIYVTKTVYQDRKNKESIYLAIGAILILSMPRDIFRQTFSWISGFSNYVPPVLLTMIYLFVVRSVFFEKREEKYEKYLYIFLIFILGVSIQLFIEHVTIYIFLISIFILVYNYIKFKKISKIDLSMLLGSIIGATIMFSNRAYYSIVTDQDGGYRSMSDGGIVGVIKSGLKQYFSIINKEFFMDLSIMAIVLSFLCISLIIKKNKVSNKIEYILKFSTTIFIIYPIYLIYNRIYIRVGLGDSIIISIMEGVFSIIFYICIIITLTKTIEEKSLLHYFLLLLCSSIILLGPLMFVKPIGWRNFLSSYVFLIMFAIELIKYLEFDLNNICIKIAINSVSIFLIVTTIYIFTSIGIDARYRENRINDQITQNKDTIYVPKIKYSGYLQIGNPDFGNNYGGEYGFRAYYGLNESIKVKLGDE